MNGQYNTGDFGGPQQQQQQQEQQQDPIDRTTALFSDIMICTKCGTQNMANKNFCTGCGSEINRRQQSLQNQQSQQNQQPLQQQYAPPENTAQQPSQPKKSKTALIMFICALVVAVIAAVVFIPDIIINLNDQTPETTQNGDALPADTKGDTTPEGQDDGAVPASPGVGFSPTSFVSGLISLPVSPDEILPGHGGEVRVVSPTIYKFIPETSGCWGIRTSNNGNTDPYLEVFDANGSLITGDDDSAGGYNAYATPFLKAGETYYIYAGTLSGPAGEYTLTAAPVPSIPSSGGEINVEGSTIYEFSPDTTCYWMFRTSVSNIGDPYLEIYDASGTLLAFDDNSGGGSVIEYVATMIQRGENALLAILLDSGETYYVSVGFRRKIDYSCILTVSTAEVIPGGGGDVRVNHPVVFPFIPDASGLWTFRTSNYSECCPFLRLLEADGRHIADDNHMNYRNNAIITADLVSGTTYFLYAAIGYSSKEGRYDLTITNG